MTINRISLALIAAFIIIVIGSASAKRTPNVLQYTGKIEYVCPPSAAIAPCRCGVESITGEIALDCFNKHVGDANMSDILDVFLTTPELSALPAIFVEYNDLTYVPHQLKFFPKVDLILADNKITIIEKDSLNYQVSGKSAIDLSDNGLTTIAPGAFRGNFYS